MKILSLLFLFVVRLYFLVTLARFEIVSNERQREQRHPKFVAIPYLANLARPFLRRLIYKNVVHVDEIVEHSGIFIGARRTLNAHGGKFVELRILRRPIFFPYLRGIWHVEPRVVLRVLACLRAGLVSLGFRRWRRSGWTLFPFRPHRKDESVTEWFDAAWVSDLGLKDQRVSDLRFWR